MIAVLRDSSTGILKRAQSCQQVSDRYTGWSINDTEMS